MRFWAVIPAAGKGARFGAELPKQYLKIGDEFLLERVVRLFCEHPRISGVTVALAKDEPYWPTLSVATHPRVRTAAGGDARCRSTLNALYALDAGGAAENDWVLVHDAARPCLRRTDLDRLMDVLADHPVGGLLAVPVRDTLKRAGPDGEVAATVDRATLWHALTPQMFRLGPLTRTLAQVLADGDDVTDEAQAMERAGMRPQLVPGNADNVKVTYAADLALAETCILRQERDDRDR